MNDEHNFNTYTHRTAAAMTVKRVAMIGGQRLLGVDFSTSLTMRVLLTKPYHYKIISYKCANRKKKKKQTAATATIQTQITIAKITVDNAI